MREFLEKIGILKKTMYSTQVRAEQVRIFSEEDTARIKKAFLHYCEICDRGFEKTKAKMMHDRHKHNIGTPLKK